MRNDFRHFRIDRIQQLRRSNTLYPAESGRCLDDYFDALERQDNITIHRD